MQNFALHLILDSIIELVEQANKYVDHYAPWKLIKTDPAKARLTLLVLLESIRYTAICLQPFVPTAAGKILDQLMIDQTSRTLSNLNSAFAINSFIIQAAPTPIFSKV